MMPKKVSGIEDSDRDDANEVTDVANGNDEAVNSEENENKDEVDNEDKDDVKRSVKRVQCLQVY